MDRKSRSNVQDDQQLVNRAMEGDEKAFANLLLRYKDSIYFMILKMVKNKDDAEDLTLEAFGKAFTSLHHYSNDFAFSTWLYRIATNNCIDFLRKQKGIHYSIDKKNENNDQDATNLSLRSNVPDPEERLILKQRGKTIKGFINRLNPQYQTLIELRFFKDYSYGEIAKELDLPLGTVKVQLFRARKKLFELIGKTDVNES